MRNDFLLPVILGVVIVVALSFTAVLFGGLRMNDLNWQPSADKPFDYTSGPWRLRAAEIDGDGVDPVDEDHTVTIAFQDGQIDGSGGCNDFEAFYGLEEDNIRITALSVTQKDCEDPDIDEVETAFLAALDRATKIARSDDVLSLYSEDLVLTFDSAG
jgi:heat shock protein HslJ